MTWAPSAIARFSAVCAASLVACWAPGCSEDRAADTPGRGNVEPMAMYPAGGPQPQAGSSPRRPQAALDLTQLGAVAWGSTPAEIIDTRRFVPQIQPQVPALEPRPIKSILPVHTKPPPPPPGAANTLRAGTTLGEERTIPERLFPTIGATGWNPPDPYLAVGPNHVVVTVNMAVAFYTKAGVQQFQVPLNSTGNPGFFETVGAAGYTFDPKCMYDPYAQRFVVLALEVYSATGEAYIDIAVSDDSDPNGVWYKYRTGAVITIGAGTNWWDYPGLGCDPQAYYVGGNLFGFNSAPYGGAGFRIFDKTPLLTGGTAVYSTLREPGGYVIQPARHFGSPIAPFFTYLVNSTTVRVYAITNPLTAPALVSTNVAVPSYSGSSDAPTLGGSTVSTGGSADPVWRNGKLYWCHNASTGGKNTVRWHQFDTGSWPTSGSVTRIQSGDIDAGPNLWTMFPAITANVNQDAGVVLGATGPDNRLGVRVAGRRASDPLGRMGVPVLVNESAVNASGRYGDYYAVAVDPADDTTFWGVGEYRTSSGWQNWVTSFRISDQSLCHPVPDDAGISQSQTPMTLDVLANDWHSNNLTMTILSFDPASVLGGTVVRSVGTGPGGRDRLIYTPPAATDGVDSFTYTVTDVNNQTAAAAVTSHLYNPANYRNPENPPHTAAGVHADYYALASAPTAMPDFSTLTPYASDTLSSINQASSSNPLFTSGRSTNLGAVFTGYLDIAATDLYTLAINSDDGSNLYVGSTLLIANDGQHGMTQRTALIGLKPGRHALRLEYFQGGGSSGLIASIAGFSGTLGAIPASMWRHAVPCPADYDNDGLIAPADVAAFVNAWLTSLQNGTLTGDFDGNGAVQPADVAAFVSSWSAALSTGC